MSSKLKMRDCFIITMCTANYNVLCCIRRELCNAGKQKDILGLSPSGNFRFISCILILDKYVFSSLVPKISHPSSKLQSTL